MLAKSLEAELPRSETRSPTKRPNVWRRLCNKVIKEEQGDAFTTEYVLHALQVNNINFSFVGSCLLISDANVKLLNSRSHSRAVPFMASITFLWDRREPVCLSRTR